MPIGPVIHRRNGEQVVVETTDGPIVIEFRAKRGNKSSGIVFVDVPKACKIRRKELLARDEIEFLKLEAKKISQNKTGS